MGNRMDYEEFKCVVMEELGQCFPERGIVLHSGLNGSESVALVTSSGDVSPTMTVRNLYEIYRKVSMESAISQFEAAVLTRGGVPNLGDKRRVVSSYELARDKLAFALYNYEANREHLADIVWYRWLDFILVLVVCLEWQGVYYTMVVEKDIQAGWNISDEKMYQGIIDNMQKEDWRLTSLSGSSWKPLECDSVAPALQEGLYGLSSGKGILGASAIIVPGFLRCVAQEIGSSSLLILPCSVDWVYIMPVDRLPDAEDTVKLRRIMQVIAGKGLPPDCWLSDKIYVYRLEVDRVLIL